MMKLVRAMVVLNDQGGGKERRGGLIRQKPRIRIEAM